MVQGRTCGKGRELHTELNLCVYEHGMCGFIGSIDTYECGNRVP